MSKKQVGADTEGERLASYEITPEIEVCCVCVAQMKIFAGAVGVRQ